jgi:hypothetical protein
MAFGYDLGVNLLAGLIGYGTAGIRGRFMERRSYRNQRPFWKKGASQRLIIVYPLYNGEYGAQFPRNMARIEDVAAAQMIAETAEAVGREPVLANDEEPIDERTDLVLICSAKGNRRSKELGTAMKALPFAYEIFADRPSEIVNKTSRVRYVSDPIRSGDRNDFALLARITDPVNNRRVFYFWGIRGIGTLGAARFVCHSPNLAEVNRTAESGDFAVVLRVGYEDPLKPRSVAAESQIILIK